MKKALSIIAIVVLSAPAGYAADADGGFTTQPERMKSCRDQASRKNLSGREEAIYLSECLKAAAQWGRIKSCNQEADAKALKGEAREKFMAECRKG